MKFKSWLENFFGGELVSLRIKHAFLEAEIKFSNADKKAAWEMYIELLTRIATQYLEPESGDEQTALQSIHSIFPTTREILKRNGSSAIQFSKVAIIVLNQIVRPFTAKWHKKSLEGAFKNMDDCKDFRNELRNLQSNLRIYTKLLSDIAGVEDLTDMEG